VTKLYVHVATPVCLHDELSSRGYETKRRSNKTTYESITTVLAAPIVASNYVHSSSFTSVKAR